MLDTAINFGSTGGRGHEMTAGPAFIKGHVRDRNFLLRQAARPGEPNLVTGDQPLEVILLAHFAQAARTSDLAFVLDIESFR